MDEENGGDIASYDEKGNFAGNDNKMIVTQARMVWFFSKLTQEGHGGSKGTDAAEMSHNFLKESMWGLERRILFFRTPPQGSN